MDKILGTYEVPKLNQENTNNLKIPIMSNQIEAVINNIPQKENSSTR
jgi:hypothetical protein